MILEPTQWSDALSTVLYSCRLPLTAGYHNRSRQPPLFPSNFNPSSAFDLEDYPVARREPRLLPPDPYYLDCIARSAILDTKRSCKDASQICGTYAICGQDVSGHRFAKKLNCGREWCELCRDDTEARRVARWLPKVMQMSSMGQWIIPIPRELAPLMRSKKRLRMFAKKVHKALKQLGYLRGLDRWHFFGDENNDYFPHLTLLVDGEWLDPQVLEDLKAELRAMIYSKFIRKRYNDKLDINYLYKPTPAMMMHALRYTCRATFLDRSWDEPMADELYKFHNCGWWGKWDQAPKWDAPNVQDQVAELADLGNSICPICKKKITWDRKPTTMSHVLIQGAVEIAHGYYRLPAFKHRHKSRASPLSHLPLYLTDDQLTPKQLLRIWQLHQVES